MAELDDAQLADLDDAQLPVRVLAVDPGYRNCGWAIVEISDVTGKLSVIACGVEDFKCKTQTDSVLAVSEWCMNIGVLARALHVCQIYVERCSGRRLTQPVKKVQAALFACFNTYRLAQTVGPDIDTARPWIFELVKPTPQQWKRKVPGPNGLANMLLAKMSRPRQKRWVMDYVTAVIGVEADNDHIADAIAMAWVFTKP